MDRFEKYGGYENWKASGEGRLKVEHEEYMNENYNPVMPDTYVSFDDFCMGQWQSI